MGRLARGLAAGAAVGAAAGTLVLGLGACVNSADDKGGNTTCGDYRRMSDSDQDDVIRGWARQDEADLSEGDGQVRMVAAVFQSACEQADDVKKLNELGR